MRPAVSIQSVSKSFSMGRDSARRALEAMVRKRFRERARPGGDSDVAFWAVDDVSFDVAPGELVGLVGRNGAGKSVLLKMIAGVTRPTRGKIEVRGRVAPLLEVGTGFHPELTGMENIFLNGVILGMRRAEVARHVDQIVEFADIGPFLETPIKHYSSGMRVRLGFAVAAHLDRDIFLLDEVLAVGDREFQEKSLTRLRELAVEGRTILVVSHGDRQIERFCSRSILLDHGRLLASGTPSDIQKLYESMN